MASVHENDIAAAFKACQKDILANLDTMTLKQVRKRLEGDMGLESDDLRNHKHFISGLIDEVISSVAAVVPEEQLSAPSPPPKKARSAKPSPKQTSRPRSIRSGLAAPKQKAEGNKREMSMATIRIRNMCKRATIGIPPSIYVKNKNDEDLKSALEGLLAKHGLTRVSAPEEVEAVKRKLSKERDLEGIDMSNVVSGPRRRQASQAAPARNYAYTELSDSESVAEESSSSDEQDSDSSDAEMSPNPRHKPADEKESDSEAASSHKEEVDTSPSANKENVGISLSKYSPSKSPMVLGNRRNAALVDSEDEN